MILLIVVLVNILPSSSRGVQGDVSFLTDVSSAVFVSLILC